MNLMDAAYNVVHDYPGGAASLAPRMNKSSSSLSHEVTASGTAKLGLQDALKITQLTGDLRILQAFSALCGQMLVPLPDAQWHEGADCLKRLADAMQQMGVLAQEVAGDLADNSISDNELRRCQAAMGKLIQDLHRMHEALAVINRTGKPLSVVAQTEAKDRAA